MIELDIVRKTKPARHCPALQWGQETIRHRNMQKKNYFAYQFPALFSRSAEKRCPLNSDGMAIFIILATNEFSNSNRCSVA